MNKEIKEVGDKGFEMGLFFLAISTGIFGNLVANVLDRHYAYLGMPYELCIFAAFFVVIWYLNRYFTRILDK